MVFAICQHESATGIHMSPYPEPHLPSPSPPCPSGLSQSTGFGHPSTCIKLALVTYFTYGNIHVAVLFSQIIIPSSSSPPESKSLCFTSLSPLLPCMYDHHCHHSKFHTYALIYSIFFLFLTDFTLYNRLQFHPPY